MQVGLRIKSAASLVLGRTRGREVTVWPDDLFLVSYPRSGNTWLRFLVGNMVSLEEPVTFANIEARVPDIYRNTDRQLQKVARPRFLKSHECFDPRYRKVIYLVRDPRDVVVSYYHYFRKLGQISQTHSVEDFVLDFVSGRLDSFGTWGENVGSWLGAREGDDQILFLRYEDLVSQISVQVRKIALFLELTLSEEALESAVEQSSFDRMQALETRQSGSWATIARTNRDIPFVRQGQVGGWMAYLGTLGVRRIETAWASQMKHFGYKATSAPTDGHP